MKLFLRSVRGKAEKTISVILIAVMFAVSLPEYAMYADAGEKGQEYLSWNTVYDEGDTDKPDYAFGESASDESGLVESETVIDEGSLAESESVYNESGSAESEPESEISSDESSATESESSSDESGSMETETASDESSSDESSSMETETASDESSSDESVAAESESSSETSSDESGSYESLPSESSSEEAGTCTVTLNMSGFGDDIIIQGVKKGSLLERTPEFYPTAEGSYFVNWYKDEEFNEVWNFKSDIVTGDMTLYAKWRETAAFNISAIQPQEYTGKAIKPTVVVYSGDDESMRQLKQGKDYTVQYKNNKDTSALLLEQTKTSGSWQEGDTEAGGSSPTGEKAAGGFNPALPHVIISGKGNYEGKVYLNFTISQIAIADEENNIAPGVTLKCNDQFATGVYKKDQETVASLSYKSKLKYGKDYKATITDEQGNPKEGSKLSKDDAIFNASNGGGERILTIEGIGNYTGTITRTIYVKDKEALFKNAVISLGGKCKSKSFFDGEGGAITLNPAWTDTEDGTYYQYIDGEWTTDSEDYDDDGKLVKNKLDRAKAFTVKYGKKWLKYGEDYEIEYTGNTSVGTATMTLVGIGGYCGTKSVTFKIKGKAFSSGSVTTKDDEGETWVSKMSYTGYPLTQEVTLSTKKRHRIDPDDKENKDTEPDYVFEYGMDYTISYVNNIQKGTATAIFTANPETGYSGSFKKTFKIVGISLAESVTFNTEDEVLEPIITETEKEVGVDKDGDPKIKVTRKVESTRYMESAQSFASGGTMLNFELHCDGVDESLLPGVDYTVKYSNNKKITPMKIEKEKWQEEDDNGKLHWVYGDEYETPNKQKMGTLTITGKGNYTGKLTIKYQIVKGNLNAEDVFVYPERMEYSAKTAEYKPKVTVMTPQGGYFNAKKDYTVEYVNNKKADVEKYLNGEEGAPVPTVKVTFKKSSNYENLDAEGYGEDPVIIETPMEFYVTKLTDKNLYVILDNEEELIYNGSQVTNVKVRAYYGDASKIKAAKKDKATDDAQLTALSSEGGKYGLILLKGVSMYEDAEEGVSYDYILSFGANNVIGKNKGSFTIDGTGSYGGYVTQKFTIYKNPVSYQIVIPEEE